MKVKIINVLSKSYFNWLCKIVREKKKIEVEKAMNSCEFSENDKENMSHLNELFNALLVYLERRNEVYSVLNEPETKIIFFGHEYRYHMGIINIKLTKQKDNTLIAEYIPYGVVNNLIYVKDILGIKESCIEGIENHIKSLKSMYIGRDIINSIIDNIYNESPDIESSTVKDNRKKFKVAVKLQNYMDWLYSILSRDTYINNYESVDCYEYSEQDFKKMGAMSQLYDIIYEYFLNNGLSIIVPRENDIIPGSRLRKSNRSEFMIFDYKDMCIKLSKSREVEYIYSATALENYKCKIEVEFDGSKLIYLKDEITEEYIERFKMYVKMGYYLGIGRSFIEKKINKIY